MVSEFTVVVVANPTGAGMVLFALSIVFTPAP
jgi:hypothetical protein